MNNLFSKVCFFVFVCQLNGISSADQKNHSDFNQTSYQSDRNRFLENLFKIIKNSYTTRVSTKEANNIPTEALNGVYVECILGLSYPCLQKKMINFLYKLDKVKNINLIGKSIAIVRKKENLSDTTVLVKIADYVDQTYLKDIIDNMIDKFFDNHLLRVKIPQYFEETDDEDTTYLDIDFGIERSQKARDGKSGKPAGGKMKGLKKLMMLIGLLTCMKLSMMGPLFLGLIGLKAMKALIMAVIALTISKMNMLGKSHSMASLLGHDGGHGGWDRTIQEQYASTASLPYHMEPPVPYNYNSYTVH